MLSIIRKEINNYRKNSLLLIAAGFIMLYSGIKFWNTLYSREIMNISRVYSDNSVVLLLFIPLLTMGSFAKEKADGTDRLLFSSAIPMSKVVIGKFMAALIVFVLFAFFSMLIPSILLIYYGKFFVEVLVLLVGLLLLGGIICSFGLLLSALSLHEFRTLLVTIAALFVWWMMDALMPYVGTPLLKGLFYIVSIFSRYKIFEYGILSYSTIIYFISIICMFLMICMQFLVLWRQKR